MNGMSVVEARRANMIEPDFDSTSLPQPASNHNTMFIGDEDEEDEQDEQQDGASAQKPSLPSLNPVAAAFSPGNAFTSTFPSDRQPKWMSSFGGLDGRSLASPGGPPEGLFGPKTAEQEPTAAPSASAQTPFSTGHGSVLLQPNRPSSFVATTPASAAVSAFTGFSFSSTSTQPFLSSTIAPEATTEQKEAEASTQSASQGSISSLPLQDTTPNPEVSKSTPIFSWSTTSTTKKETEASKPSPPLFNSSFLPSGAESFSKSTSGTEVKMSAN